MAKLHEINELSRVNYKKKTHTGNFLMCVSYFKTEFNPVYPYKS